MPRISAAAENNELIVVCLHNSSLPDELQASLPAGFAEKRYVAKFVNGELVDLQTGKPEDVIAGMIGVVPVTPAR